MPRKNPQPTLRDAVKSLADDLHHSLQSHPIADRVPQELNVAEATLALMPNLHRIASALERISAALERLSPAPGRNETTAADFPRAYSQRA